MKVAAAVLVMMAIAAWLSWRELGRLPYAPECPCCRSVTGQLAVHHGLDRLWALISATPVRCCARCGWAGRMRWRLAHEKIRDHGR